jgi:hypothetical protein
MPYIDPRLSRHLRDAYDTMLIDAIFIILETHQEPLGTWCKSNLAERVIEETIQLSNEKPSFLRFIPRASAVALTAPPRFINHLLKHPSVQVASSATIDIFYFAQNNL